MAIYDSVKNNPFLLNFAPWNNTIADDTTDEPVDTTSGLAPILYPQGTGDGNQNDGIRQLTTPNYFLENDPNDPFFMNRPDSSGGVVGQELIGEYPASNKLRTDYNYYGVPLDNTDNRYNELNRVQSGGYGFDPNFTGGPDDIQFKYTTPRTIGDQVYAQSLLDADDEDMNLQKYKKRKESGTGIRSVISTAFQGAKDFVSNLGKRRQELRDQGYSEDKINFIGANAMGKQFVDEGLYDPMGGYYDSPSGVKDKFNFNVYAKNYMKPGSSSYKKWSTIPNSRAFGMQKEKEKSALEQQISFEKQRAEQEEASRVASVAKAIQQDINRGGRGDRDNTGRNEPGGGRGQSPTGGDVSGTPFKHGGIVGVL